MDAVSTPLLLQELEPLNAQIEQIRQTIETLEGELRLAEAELESYAVDRQRYEALREICNALDKLNELDASGLFWDELRGVDDTSGHMSQLRARIEGFEARIRAIDEKKESLHSRIGLCCGDLEALQEEVRDAHAREERRQEEFLVEREISPLPFRMIVMPWTNEAESERQFRRSVLVALLLCIAFGSLIPLVNVPLPDRTATVVEIPERLAMLVKKEPPMPEPIARPQPKPEEPEPEKEQEKPDTAKKKPVKTEEKPRNEKTQVASRKSGANAARKRAESTGVLAFKDTFKDLMDETPVAGLGTEARINKNAVRAPGAARAQRSLVAIQASGSSGGIANASFSRNLGSGGTGNSDRIGGVGFARVESAMAGLAEEGGRPLSDGPGPARTDEEIQIVFDRYKATLYRIYNKELRNDPTLRGKLLLRITIEPGGEVSLCEVESTDLGSGELVSKIVKRVERFNFGPKDDVPKITILYPIDFLPAG